ncbi:hypothetical protein MED222_05800 [Vibrio sp. MED222]|nr:hypothetical protein MED222_05800 [Vibrio sp. MED222]
MIVRNRDLVAIFPRVTTAAHDAFNAIDIDFLNVHEQHVCNARLETSKNFRRFRALKG